MQTKEEGGFTLVELLLVIVILGILAAIVVAAVGNTSSDAAENACDQEEKIIRAAVQRAAADEKIPADEVNVTPPATTGDIAAISARLSTYLADQPGACDTYTLEDGAVTASLAP